MTDQQQTEKPSEELFLEMVNDVVASRNFGKPSADKRGRRKEWPYVPVLLGHPQGGVDGKLQILGKAFATREEAVAYARKCAQHQRDVFRTELLEPRMRAIREQWGLPRNVPGWTDAGQDPVTASLRALLPTGASHV